ncbi:hypothetical protein OBBRIDRAFT_871524 [Obba rivulosa]|uniref:Uncharacterized protein n=1 Tax=Obba rivulosa TaxID=1052685 RepID=A0A8E2DUC5_9APHY|nr:hypothetical protein OBBRIDRAFT_871524 [Obba rivulosa]
MSTKPTFLGLPLELRLAIYEIFLSEHQRIRAKQQPSNVHIRLLLTCKQIEAEAGSIFRRYISLRHERQIRAFVAHVDTALSAQIEWADVANDGRVLRPSAHGEPMTPLSMLHLALRGMRRLKRLRVFPCSQGHWGYPDIGQRVALNFERTMFPTGCDIPLNAYELCIESSTRADCFDVIPSSWVETLRLTGTCYFPTSLRMPKLRDLTLLDLSGNYFDQHTFDDCFSGAQLETFSYALSNNLAFPIRDRHLHSLVSTSGGSVNKLVLIGCDHLSSTVIARCLGSMPRLRYFALSLTTVNELQVNFILALPPAISVLKLQVVNAWYAKPWIAEERDLCDALETTVLLRAIPPTEVCLSFRYQLLVEEGRSDRWERIARDRRFLLEIGPWEAAHLQELQAA